MLCLAPIAVPYLASPRARGGDEILEGERLDLAHARDGVRVRPRRLIEEIAARVGPPGERITDREQQEILPLSLRRLILRRRYAHDLARFERQPFGADRGSE